MKEAWKTPISTGIFTYLQDLDVPWAELNVDSLLNMQYHINRSGQKIVSPLVENYTDNEDDLTSEEKSQIADVVFTIFGDKWSKLYELLSLEYNPISNYDMTEIEEVYGSNSEQITRTGTDTTTHTGTQSDTNTGTQANAHTGTIGVTGAEINNGSSGTASDATVYGFNSATGVPDNSVENTTQVNSAKSTNETTTHNDTDTRTDNLSHQRTDNLSDTETRNMTDATQGSNATTRTLTRSGNIGVTTSQQMVLSSIDLYQWNFFNQVFEDIDTVLTIKTY